MPHVALLMVPKSSAHALSGEHVTDESAYIPSILVYGFIGKGAHINEPGITMPDYRARYRPGTCSNRSFNPRNDLNPRSNAVNLRSSDRANAASHTSAHKFGVGSHEVTSDTSRDSCSAGGESIWNDRGSLFSRPQALSASSGPTGTPFIATLLVSKRSTASTRYEAGANRSIRLLIPPPLGRLVGGVSLNQRGKKDVSSAWAGGLRVRGRSLSGNIADIPGIAVGIGVVCFRSYMLMRPEAVANWGHRH